jgi:hypothetical protein
VIRGASPNTATIGVKELEPVEPVAQADGDSAVEIVTAVAEAAIDAQVEAASVSGTGDDPNAPPPEPVETEEAKEPFAAARSIPSARWLRQEFPVQSTRTSGRAGLAFMSD